MARHERKRTRERWDPEQRPATGEQIPQAPRPDPASPPPEMVRLANRTALVTIVAGFTLVVGLALLPRTMEGPALARMAAGAPLLLAAGVIVWLGRLRAQLRRSSGRPAH
jgi:hypothetical protein